MYNFSFIRKSNNQKTGPIAVSRTSQNSCPDSCPLKAKGCYAKTGPSFWQWRKLDDSGLSLDQFIDELETLKKGSLFRHNEAGDFGATLSLDIIARIAAVVKKRSLTAWAYSHHNLSQSAEAFAVVKSAKLAGFVINQSTNNVQEALAAFNGTIPVVTILPMDAPQVQTVKGIRVIACPAEKSDKVTCESCKLCAKPDRDYIIGFRAHGVAKKAVHRIAMTEAA